MLNCFSPLCLLFLCLFFLILFSSVTLDCLVKYLELGLNFQHHHHTQLSKYWCHVQVLASCFSHTFLCYLCRLVCSATVDWHLNRLIVWQTSFIFTWPVTVVSGNYKPNLLFLSTIIFLTLQDPERWR